MNNPTTLPPVRKSPTPFAKARAELAEIKAGETFWETFEGNPNPAGEDMDVTQAIADAIYSHAYDKRVALLLIPATSAAELFEKFVEIRIGGLGDCHSCWSDVIAQLEADAGALAMKEATA